MRAFQPFPDVRQPGRSPLQRDPGDQLISEGGALLPGTTSPRQAKAPPPQGVPRKGHGERVETGCSAELEVSPLP